MLPAGRAACVVQPDQAGHISTGAAKRLTPKGLPRWEDPVFPSRDDVEAAAAILEHRIGTHTGNGIAGQRAYLEVAAGVTALRVRSIFDAPDTAEADEANDELVLFELDEEPDPKRGVIVSWSAASRRRMVRTLAELDYSGWADDGGDLAMVTLTLPAWWEVVAPDGATFKRLVDALRKRWIREVGTPWRGLWKLEFQRRGAPHLHALLRVPAVVGDERFDERGELLPRLDFETWLSLTWAELCADSLSPRDRAAYVALGEADRHALAGTGVDFGEASKYSDPRRTAIYFLKHSAKTQDDKEYQHIVPALWRAEGAGPGRFWGYWGLRRAVGVVEVSWSDFVHARRVLRHVAKARQSQMAISRLRAAGDARDDLGVVRGLRELRRPQVRSFGSKGGGWVLVNDGLGLAYDLGRALALPDRQRR